MREIFLPLLIGGGAGALVGLGVWFIAQRQIELSFTQGSAQMAAELGIGQEELRRRFTAGREEMRRELATQVSAQVPATVRSTIVTTLDSYGLTQQRAQRLTRVLTYAEQQGWV